jgi:hypothetical protein
MYPVSSADLRRAVNNVLDVKHVYEPRETIYIFFKYGVLNSNIYWNTLN